MRITVKTGGLLGEHLPEGSSGNQAEIEVEEGCGPLDVMRPARHAGGPALSDHPQ